MKEIILAKNGEIALKGLNRRKFEEVLMRNIKWRLRDFGPVKVTCMQSTIYIAPEDCDFYDFDGAIAALRNVFGIASISRAARRLLIWAAFSIMSSVVSPWAETTTTTPCPCRASSADRRAAVRMRSASAREVPPYFCT